MDPSQLNWIAGYIWGIADDALRDLLEPTKQDAKIEPVPTGGTMRVAKPEVDYLSNILKAFNYQFGDIPWSDANRGHKLITRRFRPRSPPTRPTKTRRSRATRARPASNTTPLYSASWWVC